MGNTRTILKEYVDNNLPLGKIYSVCRHRLAGSCGDTRDNIEAQIMDEHYLISHNDKPLAIVDCCLNVEVLDRFYSEAKKTAKEIASSDKNKLIDITSRNSKISEEDKVFVHGMARKELMMS